MKRTYVAICLDQSSSMGHVEREAEKAYQSLRDTIAANAAEPNQETLLTLVTFDDVARVAFAPQDPRFRDNYHYRANGWTALFDGVGLAIETLQRLPGDADTSYLVLTITDGEENRSLRHNANAIRNMMQAGQAAGNWTFAFQLPRGYRNAFVNRFGVPMENCSEWENTRQGTEEMRQHTNSATQSYFTARAGGQSATNQFFAPVTTDLSKVNASQVRGNLDDLSNRFKSITLEAERVVKDVVEEKTHAPYIIGSAYYQLMKPEKIQYNKEVLIVEKGKKAVWGGPEARKLIGLPVNQGAKVTPGNHSNYDIYVQSRSVNRKLPRGTKVLVDVTQSKHLQPTWGTVNGPSQT